jgi:hypothetical protein
MLLSGYYVQASYTLTIRETLIPTPYPEKTNVEVLVIVQRRFNENLHPETLQWLEQVIKAGLLRREQKSTLKTAALQSLLTSEVTRRITR